MLIEYVRLRQLVGWIGFLLPPVLMIGGLLAGRGVAPSISDYYYSAPVVRDILVGSMCAIGVFLITYMGYREDRIPVKVAAASAIGVAVCPTASGPVTGTLHPIFAGLLFVTLAYICLFLFTQTWPPLRRGDNKLWVAGRRKRQRNVVYRTCGLVMLGAMVAIPITRGLFHLPYSLLACEWITVMAFGFAWLVKGGLLLKDRPV